MPDYSGAERHCDVANAVADGRIVSAPGTAPGTLAIIHPRGALSGHKEQIAEMRTIFPGEYRAR